MGTEFCSEKIPRNRLGMVFVLPRKKVLIPRHSEVSGRVNSEARNGRKWHEKNSERNSESFLFRGTAGILPEQTNFSVYSVFRGIIFCRILPTLVVILFYCCGTAQLIILLPPNSRKAHQLIESAERGADSLITSCCTQCLKVILR